MNLANKITFSRLFLIPVFMIFATDIPKYIDSSFDLQFFSIYGIYIATGIFIIASITDKLDGYVARKYNQVTKLGKFLDPLVDKLLITGALICLVQTHKTVWWAALIIISREFAVTYFRLTAIQKGLILVADKFGKIKMVFQVVAIIMAMLDNFPLRSVSSFRFDVVVMFVAVVLTVYSGINYFRINWRILNESDSSCKA